MGAMSKDKEAERAAMRHIAVLVEEQAAELKTNPSAAYHTAGELPRNHRFMKAEGRTPRPERWVALAEVLKLNKTALRRAIENPSDALTWVVEDIQDWAAMTEEPPRVSTAQELPDAELIAELTYRVEDYKRQIAENQELIAEYERLIADRSTLEQAFNDNPGATITPIRPVSEGDGIIDEQHAAYPEELELDDDGDTDGDR